MQGCLVRPQIQILYTLANCGIIHRKRKCPYCVHHPMKLMHRPDVQYEYIWKCPWCNYQMTVTTSSLACGINIKFLDTALNLWIMQSRTMAAGKMLFHKSDEVVPTSTNYFRTFRRAHSHYVEKYILPYLVLDGVIEIDESKCNHTPFYTMGQVISTRWIFGLYER